VTLALAPGLLEQTFDVLRRCGAGKTECVAYWVTRLGPEDPIADEVIHPNHSATAVGYEVDSGWVTRFFLDLYRTSRTAVAQVHTHPGPASHSTTDDTFALVPSRGFLSLVIPRFAAGPVGFEGSTLVEMDAGGAWVERDPGEVFG
jgi:hypothetical protein